ncbi:hypothetical protein N7526_005280 [Penicillium atrosanguineum]|nr:hypothetical protein N7526_005280 [Penicillium atrosanguineum]
MPERRYSSGHQDERKTSSSPSRTQSTPRTQIREPRNLVFEYSLHYTGPVPIERTVALLAREAEDRKRGRSSHGHDRYRESQAQSHPPRSVEDRSYSNQLVRSKDQSHRAIRSQSDNRHSNGREGYHEGNRHHGQATEMASIPVQSTNMGPAGSRHRTPSATRFPIMEKLNFPAFLDILFLELKDVDQTSTLSERLVDAVILGLKF